MDEHTPHPLTPRRSLDHLYLVIYGDQDAGIPGVVKRVATLEQIVEEMDHERRWVKAFAVGLTVNILASIATILALLRVLSELR